LLEFYAEILQPSSSDGFRMTAPEPDPGDPRFRKTGKHGAPGDGNFKSRAALADAAKAKEPAGTPA
jgi:hypothetical protein